MSASTMYSNLIGIEDVSRSAATRLHQVMVTICGHMPPTKTDDGSISPPQSEPQTLLDRVNSSSTIIGRNLNDIHEMLNWLEDSLDIASPTGGKLARS